MSRPVRFTCEMLPMPPMVRVDVTVHRSQMVCGTSGDVARTWQTGVLVAVCVGVLLGVLVGPTVGHGAPLRISSPHARKVPTSPAALSLIVSVHRPLPFWPLNVESSPAPVPPVLKVLLAGTGHVEPTAAAA